jgi:hypothetical protein
VLDKGDTLDDATGTTVGFSAVVLGGAMGAMGAEAVAGRIVSAGE